MKQRYLAEVNASGYAVSGPVTPSEVRPGATTREVGFFSSRSEANEMLEVRTMPMYDSDTREVVARQFRW